MNRELSTFVILYSDYGLLKVYSYTAFQSEFTLMREIS